MDRDMRCMQMTAKRSAVARQEDSVKEPNLSKKACFWGLTSPHVGIPPTPLAGQGDPPAPSPRCPRSGAQRTTPPGPGGIAAARRFLPRGAWPGCRPDSSWTLALEPPGAWQRAPPQARLRRRHPLWCRALEWCPVRVRQGSGADPPALPRQSSRCIHRKHEPVLPRLSRHSTRPGRARVASRCSQTRLCRRCTPARATTSPRSAWSPPRSAAGRTLHRASQGQL
mmetsp:Transcript_9163/g.34488  ORF Transcript_9163/g.34488 Transcript_9163/m.34488 type:complete len:225 (-) Transcript_9163:369-1043(-)